MIVFTAGPTPSAGSTVTTATPSISGTQAPYSHLTRSPHFHKTKTSSPSIKVKVKEHELHHHHHHHSKMRTEEIIIKLQLPKRIW